MRGRYICPSYQVVQMFVGWKRYGCTQA